MAGREETLRAMIDTFARSSFEDAIASNPDLSPYSSMLRNRAFVRAVAFLTDLAPAHDQSIERLNLDQVDQTRTITLLEDLLLFACEMVLFEIDTGHQLEVGGAFRFSVPVELSAEEAKQFQALQDRVNPETNQGPTGPIP